MPGEAVDVEAEFEIVDYKVTPSVESGGTLSCNGSTTATTAHYGVKIPYSVATTTTGYEFQKVELYKVVGSTETLIQEFTTPNGEFTMPDSDVKVVAVFRELLTGFTITKAGTSNGSFEVLIGTEEVSSATENQIITVSAHPVDGYKVSSITVNGESIPVDVPTFKMPAKNVTIAVAFAEVTTP